jgi:hypothetical protein
MILNEREQQELLRLIQYEQFYNIFRWKKHDLKFKNYLILYTEFDDQIAKIRSLDHNFHYGQIPLPKYK